MRGMQRRSEPTGNPERGRVLGYGGAGGWGACRRVWHYDVSTGEEYDTPCQGGGGCFPPYNGSWRGHPRCLGLPAATPSPPRPPPAFAGPTRVPPRATRSSWPSTPPRQRRRWGFRACRAMRKVPGGVPADAPAVLPLPPRIRPHSAHGLPSCNPVCQPLPPSPLPYDAVFSIPASLSSTDD
jgi:hypothetical protein